MTLEQLKRQFLEPYRAGHPITVSGRTMDIQDVERLRIAQSDQPSATIIATLRAEDQASSVVVIGGPSYEWRAAARAVDVTDDFITSPPGIPDLLPENSGVSDPGGDSRKVFVVEGRNHSTNSS